MKEQAQNLHNPDWQHTKFAKIILLCAILYCLSNVIYSMKSYDWSTGDEHWHYSYSENYLKTGETDREKIHNYNSTTPAIILNVISNEIYKKISSDFNQNRIALRAPHFIWYVLLVIGIYSLANLISNSNVAYWATLLTTLDPNLNAHAAIIGTDLPFTSISVWFFIALFNFTKNSNLFKAITLGLTYGLCFCVKYSAVFLAFPLAIGLLYSCFKNRDSINFKQFLKTCFHLILITICVMLVLNFAYSFQGTLEPLGSRPWHSEIFKKLALYFPQMPMLFTLPFLSGLDLQHAMERNFTWPVIIIGNLYPTGVWFYFILLWLLKTPLSVVLSFFFLIIPYLRKYKGLKLKIEWSTLFLSFLCFLFYFSFIFRTQVGMRYFFPCLPLAYLLLAGIINISLKTKKQKILAPLILFFALTELLPYWGNNLSFTNSIIYNKNNAYKYLADSNIDWWQNYTAGRKLLDTKYKNYHFEPEQLLPGINVFKLNTIAGIFRNYEKYSWLRANVEPIAQVGHTLLVYDISPLMHSKFLNENNLNNNQNDQIP